MALLERAHDLAVLSSHAARAAAGTGGLALVCGEPGGGKTSLVQAFLDGLGHDTADRRVLVAACDPLSTPRPLGPLHDIADDLGDDVRQALVAAAQPHEIFAAVHRRLRDHPSVLVIDDLHWADQGTIDLLRYILRRIAGTPTLVIGALRDEELPADHAARLLLGDAARSPDAVTIALQPLSTGAVAALLGDRAVDVVRIEQLTGGNPFFVSEMADHEGDDLPTSVRDAILARTVDLDGDAWDLLHLLACSPESIADRLLADLGVGLRPLRALEQRGLVRRTARAVAFRHDLCRLAVETTLPPGVDVAIHRRMIAAVEAGATCDDAVLVHHALGAGDAERVVRYAPAAARAAARSGAHTQAASFYRSALRHAAGLDTREEAELLEALATECYLIDQLDDAVGASRRAMRLRDRIGDESGVSFNHHALAIYQWYNANRATADQHVRDAIAVLGHDDLDHTALVNLGHAFATDAYFALHSSDVVRAAPAIATARRLGALTNDPQLSVRAEMVESLERLAAGDGTARHDMLRILGSPDDNFDEVYSSGYSNLTYLDVEQRRFEEAAALLAVSIPLTQERDLPICRAWQTGNRGRLQLLQGEWDAAVLDANSVLERPSAPLARVWPHLVSGLVALRRTGNGGDDLDEAWALVTRYDESIRVLPTAAALAEQAWLTGRTDPRLADAERLLAPRPGLDWARGELAVWLWRLDRRHPVGDVDSMAEPYRLQLAGRHGDAAAWWAAHSAPYEQAMALVDTGDMVDATRALAILDALGAHAVADRVRAAHGAAPTPRTRGRGANIAGLTARELEVLRLLDEGLTNAELAGQLYISAKTVDHHVSAILAKLHVRNRREAVRMARQLELIDT